MKEEEKEKEEENNTTQFREILVEFLGTFTINYLASYARISAKTSTHSPSVIYNFPSFLLTTLFILLIYPKANCHFTPVLTLASIVFQSLDIKHGMLMIFSQFVGTIFSTSLIVLTLTESQIDFLSRNKSILGYPNLNTPLFSSVNGFFAELIFTTLLVYVFLYYGKKNITGKAWIEFYAFIRGIVLIVASLSNEYICAVSMNPFPVIAGALISTNLLEYQWFYIITPLIGIILGGMLLNNETVQNFFRTVKKEHSSK